MRVNFRPHLGILADAMKEAVEVGGWSGLVNHLQCIHPEYGPNFNGRSIKVRRYSGADERSGWQETFIVIQDKWGVVGFTDCDPSEIVK